MQRNRIIGSTLRWRFEDGSARGRTYVHAFNTDGSVDFRPVVGTQNGKKTHVSKYESASIGDDVCVASYRGPEGYTLTCVLDFKTGRMVAFASNEKLLEKSHGEFEAIEDDPSTDQAAAEIAASTSK